MLAAIPVELALVLILALGSGLLAFALWRGGKGRKLARFGLLALASALLLFALVSWVLQTWFPIAVK